MEAISVGHVVWWGIGLDRIVWCVLQNKIARTVFDFFWNDWRTIAGDVLRRRVVMYRLFFFGQMGIK